MRLLFTVQLEQRVVLNNVLDDVAGDVRLVCATSASVQEVKVLVVLVNLRDGRCHERLLLRYRLCL